MLAWLQEAVVRGVITAAAQLGAAWSKSARGKEALWIRRHRFQIDGAVFEHFVETIITRMLGCVLLSVR